jgi:hypothetical protein
MFHLLLNTFEKQFNFALSNFAHGNSDRQRSMVVASNA